eukprot:6209754-Pleurochrysis_carterae.AAC.1
MADSTVASIDTRGDLAGFATDTFDLRCYSWKTFCTAKCRALLLASVAILGICTGGSTLLRGREPNEKVCRREGRAPRLHT